MTDQLEMFDVKGAEAACWANRRALLRHKTNWPALCFNASSAVDVTVVDVSEGGIGLETEVPFAKDQIVQIDLYGVGIYICRVAWKVRGRSGLAFVREPHELTDEAVADLAARIASLGTL